MAFVESIEKESKNIRRQEVAETTFSVGIIEDKRVFQLNMYGSPHRQDTEKVSQVIQFDKNSAIKLIELFQETFGIKSEDLL